MTKVDINLLIKFDSSEDANVFYRSIIPDFKNFNIEIQENAVNVKLESLKPSRARALLNSILRIVQLNEEMRELHI